SGTVPGPEDQLAPVVSADVLGHELDSLLTQALPGHFDVLAAEVTADLERRQDARAAEALGFDPPTLGAQIEDLPQQLAHGEVRVSQRCVLLADVAGKHVVVDSGDAGEAVPQADGDT